MPKHIYKIDVGMLCLYCNNPLIVHDRVFSEASVSNNAT